MAENQRDHLIKTEAEKGKRMEEVRLGTIGSGVIVHSVLDGVRETKGICLEAVYSRTEDKGRALAAEYGVEKVYTDMDAFLADSAVNCVYIATPNLLHYEQAKRALTAGKHVICEKPFVTRPEQAEELFALAVSKGMFLCEAAPTSFLPNYAILKRELPKIGRVRLVMANYSQYSSRYDKLLAGEPPNIFNPDYAGGTLMDINFYNVYLNVALFGKPASASYAATLYDLGGGRSIDTSGVVTLRYPDFVSTCAGAKDTWGENYVQIEGEQGYIYIKGGSNGLASIRVVTWDADETFDEQSHPSRWYYEVQRLTELLRAEDRVAFDERRRITTETVRVIEALRRDAGLVFPGDSA